MAKKGASEKKEPEKNEGSSNGVTVVLTADLHCEGCAQKVKRTIRHLDGVVSVKTDFAAQKITVVGNVDPAKVKEKVENKIKKKVDLVSPLPPPKKEKEKENAGGGGKNSDEKPEKKPTPEDDNKKAEQKKPKEAAVTTVVLKTKMHCDGCANKINKILNKCEGVKEVNVDLAKDQITVKGTMNMTQILPFLNTKLKREVEIVAPPKKDDKKAKNDPNGKGKEVANPKKGEEAKPTSKGEENASKIEVVNKMEYFRYPTGYGAHVYNPQQASGSGHVAQYWNGSDYMSAPNNEYMHAPNNEYMNAPNEYMNAPNNEYMNAPNEYMNAPPHYLHAPQMFSDENPNACSIM